MMICNHCGTKDGVKRCGVHFLSWEISSTNPDIGRNSIGDDAAQFWGDFCQSCFSKIIEEVKTLVGHKRIRCSVSSLEVPLSAEEEATPIRRGKDPDGLLETVRRA